MAIWEKFKSYFGIGQPGLGRFGSDISGVWRRYLDLERRNRELSRRNLQRFVVSPIQREIEEYKKERSLAPEARRITSEYLRRPRKITPHTPLLGSILLAKPSEIISHKSNLEELARKKQMDLLVGVGSFAGGLEFGRRLSSNLLSRLAKTKTPQEVVKHLREIKVKVPEGSLVAKDIAKLREPEKIRTYLMETFAQKYREPTPQELTKALHGVKAKYIKPTIPKTIEDVKMKGEKIPASVKEALGAVGERAKGLGFYPSTTLTPSRFIDRITGSNFIDILKKGGKNLTFGERANLTLHRWLYPRTLDKTIKSEANRLVQSSAVKRIFSGLNRAMRQDIHALGSKQITKEELVKKWGKEGAERIEQATKWLRKQYNEWWRSLNEIRKRYGLKPINKLPNYMHQIGEAPFGLFRLGSFGESVGVAHEVGGIAKPTAGIVKRRVAGFQPTDALEAYRDFINQAVSHKHTIPYVERWRAFTRMLERLQEETGRPLGSLIRYAKAQANLLAGNPVRANVLAEKSIQEYFPTGVRFLKQARSAYGMGTVFGRLSSALAQTSQLPISFARSPYHFTRAFLDTLIHLPAKSDWALKEASFLKGRYMELPPRKITSSFLLKKGGMALLEFLESITARTAWKTEYFALLQRGVPKEKATKLADIAAGRIMGYRGLGTRAHMFESTLGSTFGQFMLEVTNNFNYLLYDVGMKPQHAWDLMKALGTIYLFGNFFEKTVGYRTNIDPIKAFQDAIEEYQKAEDKNEGIQKAIGRIVGEVLANNPYGGFLVGLYPEYGGRLGPIKLAPRREFFGKSGAGIYETAPVFGAIREALSGDVAGFIPMGRQIQKTLQGIDVLKYGGKYPGSLVEDIEKRKERGLMYPAPTTTWEKFKAVAFGPTATKEAKHYYEEIKRPFGKKFTLFYDLMRKKGGVKTDELYETIERLRKEEGKGLVETLPKDIQKRYEERKKELIKQLVEAKINDPNFSKLTPEQQMKWIDKLYGKAISQVNKEFGLAREPDTLPIKEEDILLYRYKKADDKDSYVQLWKKYYSDIQVGLMRAQTPEEALKYLNKQWSLAKDLFVVAKNTNNFNVVRDTGERLYALYQELLKDPTLTEEEKTEIRMKQERILATIADKYTQLIKRLEKKGKKKEIRPRVVKHPRISVKYKGVSVPAVATTPEKELSSFLAKYKRSVKKPSSKKIKPITKL